MGIKHATTAVGTTINSPAVWGEDHVIDGTGIFASAEFTNIGILQPWFVRDGFHQNESVLPRGWYDATSNKTFIAYQRGTDLDIYAIYFDHTLQIWSAPVYIADNTGTTDYHYAPCIIMDNNGYLHVFFGVHGGGNLKHSKADAVRSIATWTAQATVSCGSACYPHVVKAGTDFYIFYRGFTDVGHYAYVKSTDNMATFAAGVEIADMGYDPAVGFAMYGSDMEYDSNRNAIHFVWYVYAYADSLAENIYHAYLDLDDGHIYDMAGVDYGTELSKAEADGGACLVFNSAGAEAAGAKLIINAADSYRPYIMYSNYGADWATTAHFEFKKWTGAAWSAAVDMAANLDGLSLWGDMLLSGTTLRAYLCMPVTRYVAEEENTRGIVLYTSTDSGATWNLKEVVMGAGEAGQVLNAPICIDNADSDLEVFFERDYYFLNADRYGVYLRLYAAGQNGMVYNRIKWP